MERFEIINALIKAHSYKSYLEIGVRNPDECYNYIECRTKQGVDPGLEGEYPITFRMTSDEFFNSNNQKYDIIFIDGLHIDEQVERDIINSLKFLNPNGAILLHDCNPPTIHHAREDYYDFSTSAGVYWNGTTWKAVVKVRSEVDGIYSSTVDTDWGITIIQKSLDGNKIINDNPYYSYKKFSNNKKYYLNLISVEEFLEQYIPTDLPSVALTSNNIEENNNPKLTWLTRYEDHTSMGILSKEIIKNLKNTDVAIKPILGELATSDSTIKDLALKPLNHDLGIMFAYPTSVPKLNEFRTKVVYSGIDTTGGAENFAKDANKVDFVITPSTISKERIIALGVEKPVFVLPHGIDPEVFNYNPRIKENKFKFLYVGECSDRKGIFHLLKAFVSLFGKNNNVELHIKSNTEMVFYNSQEVKDIIKDYTNIFWHISDEGHDKVIDLYKECHAYVYPSRGDSFGMTLLEAMACGLPVISTVDPGATELLTDRYYKVDSKLIDVKGHPWAKGKWGEPDLNSLIKQMKLVYDDYDNIVKTKVLKNNSDYITQNYSWEKIGEKFEQEILPNLQKQTKILTLLTSFNRPIHIENVINSLKEIREPHITNDIYIVDNSNQENKEEIINIINKNTDKHFTLYNSEFNLGQRGALLQMIDNVNINDYDFIQFTDQDNMFLEPLSTYCKILDIFPDQYIATGYLSKEHWELGWIDSKFGRLCKKEACRAGHMILRMSDFKNMMPIYLDRNFIEPRVNSSWNAGLDWELTHWNPKAPGHGKRIPFVLCLPGGVIHKGLDSTFMDRDIEKEEYTLEELIKLRD
jgi:glycosyltransferase involved in cell wall biosynthesis